jgi:hypothetical protein
LRLERRHSFHYINGIHEQASPRQKASGKDTNGKKQIPVKKIAPDRIGELVKKYLGNIGEAENAF